MKRVFVEQHEANYLEALSDLFVGFLFIFIIFLMLFALLLAEAKRNTENVTTKLTDAGQLRSQMLIELRDALKRRGIVIDIDTRNGIARLPESLLFDSGSSKLKPEGELRVAIVGKELSAILPCYAYGLQRTAHCTRLSRPVLDAMFVEGHTDNIKFSGGAMDNYDLSAARSKATFLTLRRSAPELDRLENEKQQKLISLSAYGPDRPVASNATDAGRRANRRIDLRFVVGAPTGADIEHARQAGGLAL